MKLLTYQVQINKQRTPSSTILYYDIALHHSIVHCVSAIFYSSNYFSECSIEMLFNVGQAALEDLPRRIGVKLIHS